MVWNIPLRQNYLMGRSIPGRDVYKRQTKSHAFFHRLVRYAAFPGQNRTVSDKSHQAQAGKTLTDISLVDVYKRQGSYRNRLYSQLAVR